MYRTDILRNPENEARQPEPDLPSRNREVPPPPNAPVVNEERQHLADPGEPGDRQMIVLKEFMKHLPTFQGTIKPLDVESCLRQLK